MDEPWVWFGAAAVLLLAFWFFGRKRCACSGAAAPAGGPAATLDPMESADPRMCAGGYV